MHGLSAKPGTGTQYYTEACVNWEDHPRLSEEVKRQYRNWDKQDLAATQHRLNGRTWQCGGDYWDAQLKDVVTLTAVVRKSSWCSTQDAQNGTLKLRFEPETRGETFEFDPATALMDEDRLDPNERFEPRHNVEQLP